MRQWSIDEGTAYDAVMDALLRVCVRHMDNPVQALRPYYIQSVRNSLVDNRRRENRELPTLSVQDVPLTDQPIALEKDENEWFNRALESLDESERRILERWKRGGTWQQVGLELGLTDSAAANLYHNTLAKLKRRVRALQYQAEHPEKARSGRRAFPAEQPPPQRTW